jgi:hypothetical protein
MSVLQTLEDLKRGPLLEGGTEKEVDDLEFFDGQDLWGGLGGDTATTLCAHGQKVPSS